MIYFPECQKDSKFFRTAIEILFLTGLFDRHRSIFCRQYTKFSRVIFPRHFVPELCRRHCESYVNRGAELLQRFALLIFFLFIMDQELPTAFHFFFPSRAQHKRPLPFDFRGGQRRACTRVAARPGPISEFRGHVERMARSVSCDHV